MAHALWVLGQAQRAIEAHERRYAHELIDSMTLGESCVSAAFITAIEILRRISAVQVKRSPTTLTPGGDTRDPVESFTVAMARARRLLCRVGLSVR